MVFLQYASSYRPCAPRTRHGKQLVTHNHTHAGTACWMQADWIQFHWSPIKPQSKFIYAILDKCDVRKTGNQQCVQNPQMGTLQHFQHGVSTVHALFFRAFIHPSFCPTHPCSSTTSTSASPRTRQNYTEPYKPVWATVYHHVTNRVATRPCISRTLQSCLRDSRMLVAHSDTCHEQ